MNDLDRFVTAQAGSYDAALAEVKNGRKVGHWMWYIFPQHRELGRSANATHYGINDLAEARAYMAHPILGPRLREISEAMLTHAGTPAEEILGGLDAMKLRSCATLFERIEEGVFTRLIETFFNGERCGMTLVHLTH